MTVAHISGTTARRLVDRVKAGVDDLRDAITTLWDGQGWLALGYDSWDALCDAEFAVRIALPTPERKQIVGELAGSGMSDRAISGALGVPRTTVQRDRAQVAQSGPPVEPVDTDTGEINPPPAPAPPIQGRDGKTYTRPTPDPKREAARAALAEITTPSADVEYRQNLRKAYSAALSVVQHDPARVAEVMDSELWALLASLPEDIGAFVEKVRAARPRNLRSVK